MKPDFKKIIAIIFLLIFVIASIKAQYVNEEGEAKVDEIVIVLNSFEPHSLAQDSMSKVVIQSLLASTKVHPVLLSNQEKKKATFMTMVDITAKRGKFTFLSNRYQEDRERALRIKNDTVDSKIYTLQRRYLAFEDSLKIIEKQFIEILESPPASNNSKILASELLSRSNNLDIANFVFENQSKLTFGTPTYTLFDDDVYSECWACDRGAIADLMYAKVMSQPDDNSDKLRRNWLLFPLMIYYWGNKSWCEELENKSNPYTFELQIFWELTRGYEKPWLLYEFMVSNAEYPNTKILNDIEEYMKGKKLQFEEQLKNEK